MMDFVVDSTGAVRDARVQTSTGLAAVEEIARRAIRQGSFQPAILNRRPVSVQGRMPIQFTVGTPRTRTSRPGTRPHR